MSQPTPRRCASVLPKTSGVLALLFGLSILPVHASNWADRVHLNGFASAKYQQMDVERGNYFNGDADTGIGRDGSFRGTLVGINLAGEVSDRISIATQFLATQEDENYAMHLDWGFIDMRVVENLSLRAGKIKFPTGIVNEYISVGNAYPWITPPMLFYTEEPSGPNITREAYTGGSLLWEKGVGDATLLVDGFAGDIKLENMHVHGLVGVKFSVDWSEEIQLQASYYRGTMRNTTPAAMEGKTHANYAFGARLDWNNVVGYAEWARTDMEIDTANSTAWYATLGYQFGNWLPHLTYQNLLKGDGTTNEQKQNIATAGLRYDLTDTADVKFEYSIVRTDAGQGLFESTPDKGSYGMFGLAVDVIF